MEEQFKNNLLGELTNIRLKKLDIKSTLDENEFDTSKNEDIVNRYNVENDIVDFKIKLLQDYIQELFIEKRFLDYKREQEEKLSKEEYLDYINNKKIYEDKWFNEFLSK